MAPRVAPLFLQLVILRACHGSVICDMDPPTAMKEQSLLQTQKQASLSSEAPGEHRHINTFQVRTGSRPAEDESRAFAESQRIGAEAQTLGGALKDVVGREFGNSLNIHMLFAVVCIKHPAKFDQT